MMLTFVIALFVLHLRTAQSIGHFINPGGSTEQSFNIGSTLPISWNGTNDYNILSLGIFSTTNKTASWLISNSKTFPTSFKWIVHPEQLGFNLSSSHTFEFVIVNGTNSGEPFGSSQFNVNVATASSSSTHATQTSSSSSGSATSTSSKTSSATSSSTASSSSVPASHGLSSGAQAGIGIGVTAVVLALVGSIAFFIIQRRKTAQYQGSRLEQISEKARSSALIYPGPYQDDLRSVRTQSIMGHERPLSYDGMTELPGPGEHGYVAELSGSSPTTQR